MKTLLKTQTNNWRLHVDTTTAEGVSGNIMQIKAISESGKFMGETSHSCIKDKYDTNDIYADYSNKKLLLI